MGSVSKQHNFVWDEDANPDHVNENFDDIYSFVNTQTVHKDASIAFTAIPSGPATNPTTDNQFSRKKYVDDKAATGTTALNAAALARPTFTGFAAEAGVLYSGTTAYTTGPTVATTQFKIAAGTSVFTNNLNVVFQTAFPNGLVSVVATVGDNSAADIFKVDNESKTGFSIQGWKLNPANPGVWDPAPGACRANWIAIGW